MSDRAIPRIPISDVFPTCAITVIMLAHHGRQRKLHRFSTIIEHPVSIPVLWTVTTPPHRGQEFGAGIDFDDLFDPDREPSPVQRPQRHQVGDPRHQLEDQQPYASLADYVPTLNLAKGVDITPSTMLIILNAVRSGLPRHRGEGVVDLDGIKNVVSQLGSRIAKLDTLASETRRHAESALYAEILKRCATLS